jgi:hypothetical protein
MTSRLGWRGKALSAGFIGTGPAGKATQHAAARATATASRCAAWSSMPSRSGKRWGVRSPATPTVPMAAGVEALPRGRAFMPEVGIISLDSAENVLQAHGAGADGVRCSPAQVAVRAAVEGLGRSAALHHGDGSLRERSPPGSGDRRSRPRGPTYRTGLRQAVRDASKERHGRCRGDRRGGVPSDHAVCGGEERGSAGSCDGVWNRRSSGPAAHPDDQCVVPEARLPV